MNKCLKDKSHGFRKNIVCRNLSKAGLAFLALTQSSKACTGDRKFCVSGIFTIWFGMVFDVLGFLSVSCRMAVSCPSIFTFNFLRSCPSRHLSGSNSLLEWLKISYCLKLPMNRSVHMHQISLFSWYGLFWNNSLPKAGASNHWKAILLYYRLKNNQKVSNESYLEE